MQEVFRKRSRPRPQFVRFGLRQKLRESCADTSPSDSDIAPPKEQTVSRKQVRRLIFLATDFNKAIATLPKERQQAYRDQHEAAIGPWRRGETFPLLDMRLD